VGTVYTIYTLHTCIMPCKAEKAEPHCGHALLLQGTDSAQSRAGRLQTYIGPDYIGPAGQARMGPPAAGNLQSSPLPSCHWIGCAGTRVLCSCGQHRAHALAGRASSTLAAAAAPAPPRPRPAQSRRRPAAGRTPPPRLRGAGALQRARAASARRWVERVPAGAPCTCPRITKARAAFVAGTPQPPRLAPVSLASRLARPACAPGGARLPTHLHQCPPVCTPRCSSRHAGPWGLGLGEHPGRTRHARDQRLHAVPGPGGGAEREPERGRGGLLNRCLGTLAGPEHPPRVERAARAAQHLPRAPRATHLFAWHAGACNRGATRLCGPTNLAAHSTQLA